MKQIFIPNMTYDNNKLSKMEKKTETFILGLSSSGCFHINTNKIMKIYEIVNKSYHTENIFVNEVTKSFHTTNYLPLDIIYLHITREMYHVDNICLCIEHFTQNSNKQKTRKWIELYDDRADENTTYEIISSFLSNLNIQ